MVWTIDIHCVSSWLSPHLTFSFEALLGIIISCWRLFSSNKSLLMAKATPILLDYCPLVIILILGTTASICAMSFSIVLAPYIARITLLLSLMILAIPGHFELWALLSGMGIQRRGEFTRGKAR